MKRMFSETLPFGALQYSFIEEREKACLTQGEAEGRGLQQTTANYDLRDPSGTPSLH